MRRAPVVERRDQRLDDRDRAVVRARVAPRLEVVRLGDVPVHVHRRLVVVRREVRAERHLVHRLDEREVARRVVDRIAAEDDERLHGAGVHVGDELLERIELIDRRDFDADR